jgi:hypothetical protein
MTAMIPTDKPFQIDKKRVYEAYKAVRSNRGAAGVDGQTLELFEKDLKGNLYKIWNRMSSGSYFPPPVRAVSIPKKGGDGERILGGGFPAPPARELSFRFRPRKLTCQYRRRMVCQAQASASFTASDV